MGNLKHLKGLSSITHYPNVTSIRVPKRKVNHLLISDGWGNLFSDNSSVTNCATNGGQCPLANMAIIKTSARVSWLNTAAESSQFGALHGPCQWNSASSGKIESRSIFHWIHWLLVLACAMSGSGNGTLEWSADQLRRANEFAIFPLSTKWKQANLIGEMLAHFFWIELNWQQLICVPVFVFTGQINQDQFQRRCCTASGISLAIDA